MKATLAVLLLFIVLFIACVSEQAARSELDLYLDAAFDVWQFHGAYLVARGDSVLASGGRGFADLESRRPNTSDTRFLIGSATKPFTAIAIMKLWQEGKIDLDAPLAKYLKDYPSDVADRVTIGHLLSHRSGIPDLVRNQEFARRITEAMEPEEIVTYFRDLPLEFAPGSDYAYSSSNYVLLGLVVEAVAGPPWADYMQENICRPLGMTATGVFQDYPDLPDFAIGYAPGQAGPMTAAPVIDPSCGYAAGSLASTVEDLYKLCIALDDTILLSREAIDLMLTPHSPAYGYGWLVDDFGGHRLAAHGGGLPGYASIVQRWVDDSVCVIVLSNNVMAPAHTIATALAAIALGEQYEMPKVKTPIELSIERLAQFEGEYILTGGESRVIKMNGPHLTAQRGRGPAYPILPETETRFYFGHDHTTTLEFIRDAGGSISGHIFRQAFQIDTAHIRP